MLAQLAALIGLLERHVCLVCTESHAMYQMTCQVHLFWVNGGNGLARLHTLRGSEATDVLHQPLKLLVVNIPLHNAAALHKPLILSQCGMPYITCDWVQLHHSTRQNGNLS